MTPSRPPKPSAKARRSAARLAAVQALYQIDLAGAEPEAVLGEFALFRFGRELDGERYVEPDAGLFNDIVRGVAARRDEVDAAIRGALDPQWSLDRIEPLLASILRAGTWELLANVGVAARIVIADQVRVAQAFYGGREPAVANAVLDRVARSLRPAELGAAPDRAPPARPAEAGPGEARPGEVEPGEAGPGAAGPVRAGSGKAGSGRMAAGAAPRRRPVLTLPDPDASS